METLIIITCVIVIVTCVIVIIVVAFLVAGGVISAALELWDERVEKRKRHRTAKRKHEQASGVCKSGGRCR